MPRSVQITKEIIMTQDTTLYAGWKGKLAAPAGLKGGVMKIEGTTSVMEYAASKDGSGGWTDCQQGITVVPWAGSALSIL